MPAAPKPKHMKREVIIFNASDERQSNAAMRKVAKAEGDQYFCCEPVKNKRSNQANNYYWGVVLAYATPLVSDDYGEELTDGEAHEILKDAFLPSRELINRTTGEVAKIHVTTTDKDSKGFAQYLDRIILWCAERGVDVPDSSGNYRHNPLEEK